MFGNFGSNTLESKNLTSQAQNQAMTGMNSIGGIGSLPNPLNNNLMASTNNTFLSTLPGLQGQNNNSLFSLTAAANAQQQSGIGGSLFNNPNFQLSNNPMGLGAVASTNFPSFNPVGVGMGATNQLGQPAQQNQSTVNDSSQTKDVDSVELLKIALKNPKFFGDERDEVIRKLNNLCCQYGCSYGLVAPGTAAVSINEKNPFCKFKLITYLPRFKHKDADGIVTMDIAHPIEAIQNAGDNFLAFILRLVSSKIQPILTLTIDVHETIKIEDRLTRMVFCIKCKDNAGNMNAIGALKLLEILNDDVNQELLRREGVTSVDIKSDFTPELEGFYRKYPPYGIDHQLWNESFDNNPNPSLYVPCVLLGFQGVSERVQALRSQAYELIKNIKRISTKFNENKSNYFSLNTKLTSYSDVIQDLLSRVLRLYCLRERISRSGEPLIEYEEKFKIVLKNMCTKIVDLQTLKKRLQRVYEQKKKVPQPIKASKEGVIDGDAVALASSTSLTADSKDSLENCDTETIELLFKHLNNYNHVLTKLVEGTKHNMSTLDRVTAILRRHQLP